MKQIGGNFHQLSESIAKQVVLVSEKMVHDEIKNYFDCSVSFQGNIYIMIAEIFCAMAMKSANICGMPEEKIKDIFFKNAEKLKNNMEYEMKEIFKFNKEGAN